MRLIDADALKEHLRSCTGMFTDELGFVISLDAVLGGIDFQPTIDAEPVKHGEWQEELIATLCTVDGEGWADIMYRCSLCDCISDVDYPYCPHCGAKNDGGNDE